MGTVGPGGRSTEGATKGLGANKLILSLTEPVLMISLRSSTDEEFEELSASGLRCIFLGGLSGG